MPVALQVATLSSGGDFSQLQLTERYTTLSWQASATSPGLPPQGLTAIALTAGASLVLVGLGRDGTVWVASAPAQGGSAHWQQCIAAGGPSSFRAISCAVLNDGLHLACVDGQGQLWHTVQTGATWIAWEPVNKLSTGGPQGGFTAISCASTDGATLQLLGVGADQALWMTLRYSAAKWLPAITAVSAPSSYKDVSCYPSFKHALLVACVTVDGKLQESTHLDAWWDVPAGAYPVGTWDKLPSTTTTYTYPVPSHTFVRVTCCVIGETSQLVGLGSDGQIWISPVNSDGTWQYESGTTATTSKKPPPANFSAVAVAAFNSPGGGGPTGHGPIIKNQ
jgi:hypothetical protein